MNEERTGKCLRQVEHKFYHLRLTCVNPSTLTNIITKEVAVRRAVITADVLCAYNTCIFTLVKQSYQQQVHNHDYY